MCVATDFICLISAISCVFPVISLPKFAIFLGVVVVVVVVIEKRGLSDGYFIGDGGVSECTAPGIVSRAGGVPNNRTGRTR